MKAGGTPQRYVSGPHSGDYYLLLDEQSDHIFATRLAAHICEARGICGEPANLAAANLPEIWIDDANRLVWYVFTPAEPAPRRGAA